MKKKENRIVVTKTEIKKIDIFLLRFINLIFFNISLERIIKKANAHKYDHNSLKFKVWKDKNMLVPIPPIPKNPIIELLLIVHSNLYMPKFLKVFISGLHIKVIKEESLGPLIWFKHSKSLFSIASNCSEKTFEFTAI